MFKLGFTGTQLGCTQAQLVSLIKLVRRLNPNEVMHGMCIGADAEFHEIVGRVLPDTKRKVFPCTIVDKQARLDYKSNDYIHEPALPPLMRNQMIVDMSDAIIGVSAHWSEVMRSGTWATIRRARNKGIPRYIIWPDGQIKEEIDYANANR